MNIAHRRGGVITIVLGCLVAGSVLALAVSPLSPTTVRTKSRSNAVPPGEVATVLTLAGITPETLAASGVTVGECTGVFDAATVYGLETDRLAELRTAIARLNRANDAAAHPGRRNGPPEQRSLTDLRADVESLKEQALAAATRNLVGSQSQKLANIRANRQWSLPIQYLTVNRERARWLALRAALNDQKSSQAHGREMTAENAALLAAADADPSVGDAKRNLAERLQGIKDAWNARFGR